MSVSECGRRIRIEHLRLKQALLGPAITVETTVTLKDALHICHAHLCVCVLVRVRVFLCSCMFCVCVCACVFKRMYWCARVSAFVCPITRLKKSAMVLTQARERERQTDRQRDRQRERVSGGTSCLP